MSTLQGGPNYNNIKYIQIGTQNWATTNLDTACYINGDSIPQITNNADWANLTTGAWCYYNNDFRNGAIYGKLYNWYAVNDPRGIAPQGWHVANNSDWNILIDYLGGSNLAGGALKESGYNHWPHPNTGATNSSGFGILPGGYRQQTTGMFYNINVTAELWSATQANTNEANHINIGSTSAQVSQVSYLKTMGFSVRLIKD